MLKSLLPDDMAVRLDKEVVVDPSLDYSVHPNNTMGVFDGKSGELVQEITSEGNCLRVSRRKLRTFVEERIEIQVCSSVERAVCFLCFAL